MTEPTQAKEKAFLEELTELSVKHGLIIGGGYDGQLLLGNIEKPGEYKFDCNDDFEWIDDSECPIGYKIATLYDISKYKKPEDYQFKYKFGGNPWSVSTATDGEWMPELGKYAVRTDHVWEELESDDD
jgi:hypothetical protein